jgi:hypothetical protein
LTCPTITQPFTSTIDFQEKTDVENKVTEGNSQLEEAKTAQDRILKQNVSISNHLFVIKSYGLGISLLNVFFNCIIHKRFFRKT